MSDNICSSTVFDCCFIPTTAIYFSFVPERNLMYPLFEKNISSDTISSEILSKTIFSDFGCGREIGFIMWAKNEIGLSDLPSSFNAFTPKFDNIASRLLEAVSKSFIASFRSFTEITI